MATLPPKAPDISKGLDTLQLPGPPREERCTKKGERRASPSARQRLSSVRRHVSGMLECLATGPLGEYEMRLHPHNARRPTTRGN